jgi:signal transduction histidine kinase
MKTLNHPQQPGTPMSAQRHGSQHELAVLSRVNHDMRSPLSVILGVFELLADAGSLTDSEQRYLQLGMKAAEELLGLADALRLYSAIERDLVTLDATPVDLGAMAREHLEAALTRRGVSIQPATAPRSDVRALGDAGYLKMALTGLARHLAAHLPEQPARAVALQQRVDGDGRVELQVTPEDSSAPADARDNAIPGAAEPLEHDDLGVLNGMRLIELMGGRVSIEPHATSLVITLPAAAD